MPENILFGYQTNNGALLPEMQVEKEVLNTKTGARSIIITNGSGIRFSVPETTLITRMVDPRDLETHEPGSPQFDQLLQRLGLTEAPVQQTQPQPEVTVQQ